MIPRLSLAAILLLLLVPGCDDAMGPRTELYANRAKWSSNGPADYTYRLQVNCFCLPAYVQPVRITVQDDQVIDVVSDLSDSPLPPDEAMLFQITVDSLFEWVEGAMDQMAQEVRVTYDGGLGYPRHATIDYSIQLADDEFGFAAELLAP